MRRNNYKRLIQSYFNSLTLKAVYEAIIMRIKFFIKLNYLLVCRKNFACAFLKNKKETLVMHIFDYFHVFKCSIKFYFYFISIQMLIMHLIFLQ